MLFAAKQTHAAVKLISTLLCISQRSSLRVRRGARALVIKLRWLKAAGRYAPLVSGETFCLRVAYGVPHCPHIFFSKFFPSFVAPSAVGCIVCRLVSELLSDS